MWVRALAILLLASQALSAPLDARNVVGSCRYEKTSVALLTCLRPGGNWSPPSAACCKALLYAIDELPGSGESGACCLCRYMRAKGTSPGLAMSYIMCQGKDRHTVNRWAFPVTSCYAACPRSREASSAARKDRPVVHKHGASNAIFVIMWAVAAVICVVLLFCCWYLLWWVKPEANVPKSPESGRGLFLEGEGDREMVVRPSCLDAAERTQDVYFPFVTQQLRGLKSELWFRTSVAGIEGLAAERCCFRES